ncbi:MAG: LamB/YcsF family protein [Proteobacteria bacterium]|nr:LamB/YcsF family protein [Pseudomonadota bacterium]
MTATIDLNADLGESFGPWPMGNDAALLDIVTSANVACGFHAGDPLVMARTVALCRDKGVGIGAHPGFDDLRGFGRRRILDPDPQSLRAMLIYQIGALQGMARAAGASVRHVKLHGALSNMASEDAGLARRCIAAIREADPALVVMAMAATPLETEAVAAGAPVAREVFADRAYNDDGTLVARGTPGAMIEDPDEAADRVLRMIEERALVSLGGRRIAVEPQTVCTHGDSPSAVAMAERLRTRLEQAGVRITAFPLS